MDTLYQRIFEELYRMIAEGQYKAGDLLPTEQELCEKYNVSRITASRALNELRAQNLIERKKKKGSTFVIQFPDVGEILCEQKSYNSVRLLLVV